MGWRNRWGGYIYYMMGIVRCGGIGVDMDRIVVDGW